MNNAKANCKVTERLLGRSMHALVIENDVLSCTILLDKGADIYELIYKPKGIDVLWKSPWGLKEPARNFYSAPNSMAGWLETYAGGWQELFPNGGTANQYKGVELNYHGEASMIAWDYDITELSSQVAEVRFFTHLARSPFKIERSMRLEAGQPVLTLSGKVTNNGAEAMDYMWSHHPAFGAPFLSQHCVLDVGAKTLLADDDYVGTNNPLTLSTAYPWPKADDTDMSLIPHDTPRDTLAYLTDFEEAWAAITNTELGFGFGMTWDKEVFPYAWYWQEMNSSPEYPWYGSAYVMAIEPASSIPGQGLVTVMEKTATHRTLQAGESTEMSLSAVFYESTTGVKHISADASVTLK